MNNRYAINESELIQMMDNMNQNIISSHDIISRCRMPTLSLVDIPARREEFGDATMDIYEKHLTFSRRLQMILTEIIDRRESISRISLLLTTMYKMGVAESHALITQMYTTLLNLNFTEFTSIMLFHLETQKAHAVLLIGKVQLNNGAAFKPTFEKFSDDILVVDPLLSHVGPANQYASQQREYLSKFNFTTIASVQAADINHLPFTVEIEQKSDALVEELKTKHGLKPFMSKKLLPLAKTGYDCSNDTYLNDIPNHHLLPQNNLNFFGLQKNNGEIDAVCPVESRLDILQASGLGRLFSKGRFYSNKEQQRFFVIPNIHETTQETTLATTL